MLRYIVLISYHDWIKEVRRNILKVRSYSAKMSAGLKTDFSKSRNEVKICML